MWVIVLITLVGLIIGKFVNDNIRQNFAMKKSGGMVVKYAELVDACLACEGAGILQEKPTFISIGGKVMRHGSIVYYAFWIQHTFNNKLIVKYVLKAFNMPQKIAQRWDFPQHMPPRDMIKAMRKYLDELKPQRETETTDTSKFISNRFSVLIKRLKMEDTGIGSNLYKVSILKDTLLEYSFKIEMKFASYIYIIRFWHGNGKLQIILQSTNYIKGQWDFPLDMDQSAIADKIEADIDTMVTKEV